MEFAAQSLEFFDSPSLQLSDFARFPMIIVLVVFQNLGFGSSFVSSAQAKLQRETDA
jgi:hypothetical protein